MPTLGSPPPKARARKSSTWNGCTPSLPAHPGLKPEDVQRTLLELTVQSVVRQLPSSGVDTVYACGGGTRNTLLMDVLAQALAPVRLTTTDDAGLAPEWVEPVAFAWLAKLATEGVPGNLPEATGARGPRVLGAIYPA